MYSRDELTQFTLQKLASIYPQTLEMENMLKEVFEQRASVSNYFVLTNLVDVRNKWQEDILQKYIDEKREEMPPENPVSLTDEDEAKLDSNTVTKEIELELQAKLDKHNSTKKGILSQAIPQNETVGDEFSEPAASDVAIDSTLSHEEVTAEVSDQAVKKKGRPSKKDEANDTNQ